jgi:phosphoribosylanthranilate isomerase
MTQIKICGITNIQDATVAVEAGADMLGFIFVPNTPRFIEPEHASEIVAAIRNSKFEIRFVGVFVNDSTETVRSAMQIAQLDYAQLHGDESVDTVCALSPHIYKSLRPRDATQAHAQIEMYRDAVEFNTPAFLVDAYDAKQYGGTGKRADWDIARDLAQSFPILLAGGLNAENVADAIRVVQPWGVDVSSGVERAPGLKDHARVKEFIANAKIQ